MRRGSVIPRPVCLLVASFIAMVVFAGSLDAQRGGRRGGGTQDRAELEQRVRAQMSRMMKQRLGLTDEQAERLAEVTQSFEGRRRELARSEQATRRRVEALMLEGGDDDVEAVELLERMTELRSQEASLFMDEQVALLEVLTPVQVLRMQSMRNQLGQRIRALRRGRGRDPGGMRRPGGLGTGGGMLGPASLPSGTEPMRAPRGGGRWEH